MFLAQHPAAGLQHLFLKRPRAGQVALGPERVGQVAHAGEGVRVFLAQHPAEGLQHLFLKRAGAGQVALGSRACRPGCSCW